MESAQTATTRQTRPTGRRRLTRLALRIVLLLAALLGAAYVYQRWLLTNFHVVVPGKVYRSAQPSPAQIRNWAQRYRLKTVVNLRGASDAEHFRNEQQAAESAGVQLVPIRLSARDLPSRPALLKLIEVLETGEMPMLIHCFAGADRSGMASVLAAMAVGGEPYDQARKQMSWRYLHVDDNPEHIAGLLHKYEQWCAETGRDTAGWQQFRRWAVEHYHVKYYRTRIETVGEVSAPPSGKAHLPVRIVNRSSQAIPISSSDLRFWVVAFTGSSLESNPDKTFGWLELKGHDLAPGQALQVRLAIRAPAEPGRYPMRVDLVDETTWFGEEGSPVAEFELLVTEDEVLDGQDGSEIDAGVLSVGAGRVVEP